MTIEDRKAVMETERTDIDERWMAEWVEFGMREFESYLGKHRKFDDYYARRSRRRPVSAHS
jgi:hypothetical protein